jgi:hypothetical protein
MEPEVQATRPRKTSAKPPLTIEAASEKILADLQKKGAKGASSLYTKAQAKNAAVFEAALALLTNEQQPEVFVDRRGPKPKYFLWAFRPKPPTAETVAAKLLPFLQAEHPRIHSKKTLNTTAMKNQFGLTKEEAPLLSAALQSLCDVGSLTPLEYPTKPAIMLYLAATAAPPAAPAAAPAFAPERIREAYRSLTSRSGFPAVSIAKLAAEAAADLDALKAFLREEYRTGRIVLSLGDWSIASEDDRRGVIELHGQRYLQVRWL